MSVVLYGIKNCDSIKKARKWLEKNAIDYIFHDYRADGLSHQQLVAFEQVLGWQALLNKRGTTWRKLDDAVKDSIEQQSAIELMLEQPAMIKRPLLDNNGELLLAFSEQSYQQAFNS